MSYAASTTVEIGKSKQEIERLLIRYGATGFMIAWLEGKESVAFELANLRIRFSFPTFTEADFATDAKGRPRNAGNLKGGSVKSAMEQAQRTRWRELLLLIKAKLVAIEAGITTVEEEFHANVILPNGQTMKEWTAPYLKQTYVTGQMPPMLPPGPERD